MARPGKAIFDVAMMAGWAFAAVLTGLVALTMVDDTGDSATGPSVVATLGNDDSRLVTGSIDRQPTGTIQPNDPQHANPVARQNESFNPFTDQVNRQSDQIRDVLAELNALKREVAAFHVSTKRLRNENDLLRQRLVKLEQNKLADNNPVRVVTLPKRDDNRTPYTQQDIKTMGHDPNLGVDTNPTGSIAPMNAVPPSGPGFDPFKTQPQPSVKVSQEPLNMDLTVEGPNGRMMLPKIKPSERPALVQQTANGRKPISEVVAAPQQALSSSQTSFGLDLGQFISIADLDGAWKEISISQRPLVGDLKPLSKVVRTKDNQLALNLVAGPIQNAAQAATICAKLNFLGYGCHVSVYQGQALASR